MVGMRTAWTWNKGNGELGGGREEREGGMIETVTGRR